MVEGVAEGEGCREGQGAGGEVCLEGEVRVGEYLEGEEVEGCQEEGEALLAILQEVEGA